MKDNKKGMCIISNPVSKAFVTPLTNLEKIMCGIFDNVYVIAGCTKEISLDAGCSNLDLYRITPTVSNNLLGKLIEFIISQLKFSFLITKQYKNYGACIFFMEFGPYLPMLIAKLLNKKTIWMLPSSFLKMSDSNRGSYPAILSKTHFINYFLADKILVYSNSIVKEWGLERYKYKINFSHEHFLDINEFNVIQDINNRPFTIGYIGRFSNEKGIMEFVRAIPLILKEKPGSNFLIIGDGNLMKEVKEYLSDNNLNEYVTTIGWVPHEDLPYYLNKMKLLVIPSYTEGLPNVMLEAMACGTPVIASPVGSIPDIITNDKTGLVIDNNSPERISAGVMAMLDRSDLKAISDNARELVKREYTYEAAVRNFYEIMN